MIITLKKNTPQEEIQKMIEALESKNDVAVTLISGENYNVFGIVGDTTKIDEKALKASPYVEDVTRNSSTI